MKSIEQYEQKEKKSKKRLPLQAYLAYLLVCTFLLGGVSFSRYITFANGSDRARVAAGVVTVSYNSDNTNMKMERPADDGTLKRDFSFNVSKSDSEVAIRYDVVVTLDQPLGTGVTMTLDGNPGTEGADHTYTFSDTGTFMPGEQSARTHTLSFTGDFKNIPSGTDDTYKIQITIRSQQID